MLFTSTRGGAPAVSSAQAIVDGLAPDGGLYTPSPSSTGAAFSIWTTPPSPRR